MNFLYLAVGVGVGLVVGAAAARIFQKKADSLGQSRLNQFAEEKAALSERLRGFEEDRGRLQAELVDSRQTVLDLTKKIASSQSSQEHLGERLKSQQDFMAVFEQKTRNEFENLAQKILEAKTKTFSEQTEKNLEVILKPLKERIGHFEKKVDESYATEAKERFALKFEVGRLIELNEKMTLEANHLTQALKGDNKFQGDWGEMVLEKILETSGLREGHEYTVQRQHLDSEGDRFRPDVIVHLPDSKHIIVDAKVSLKSYELYCRTHDPKERELHLLAHLKSVLKHVDELSEKHYPKLKGINSPEFVFLFTPIEPAYLLLMQNDSELASKAWRRGVAIVTASTLFTSLKTVASIWRLENQNKNALEIATEGGKLYDKFVGFLEDFEKIGKLFESGQSQYSNALGKLRDGPGNIFRKMELLRELGASPNKKIKSEFLT